MSREPPVGLSRRRLVQLAVLLAVTAAIFLLGPRAYPNWPFFLTTMVFMLLAYGINLIYGMTGYLPFGYSVFYGLGAYGVYIGLRLGMGEALSFLFAVAVTLGLAVVLLPLFRLRSHYFAIATLAALMGVYYLVDSSLLAHWTGAGEGASLAPIYKPTLTYYITLVLLLAFVAVTAAIKFSRYGLGLRAIRGSVITAALDGVNVPRLRGIAWVLSALMAALAGAMYGWYVTFFYPDTVFSVPLNVYVIAYAIFGGAGTLTGPLIGTLVLNVIYNFINVSAYSNYLPMVFGVILIALILLMPNGLVDLLNRRAKARLP
ncbi:MAG: branched-chain amino acid ABC transporter permease [Acidilobus sp.]